MLLCQLSVGWQMCSHWLQAAYLDTYLQTSVFGKSPLGGSWEFILGVK